MRASVLALAALSALAAVPAAAQALFVPAGAGPLFVHRLVLETDERFAFDSAEITDAAAAALLPAVEGLATVADPKLLVVGHADRIGDADYNRDLSRRRAEAVADWFAARGALARADIGVAAFGEDFPVVACEGETGDALKACLAPNRRVEVLFPAAGAVAGDHVVLMREVAAEGVDLVGVLELPAGSVRVAD